MILQPEVFDEAVRARAVQHVRDTRAVLPTFAELADPASIPQSIQSALNEVEPDEARPANLFRVHWHNDRMRKGLSTVPDHVLLPQNLTGVAAPIVVALGDRFPMIRAHKVLAAYACLVTRLVTGRFDPGQQRAIWPSTGNYCRGGVAISRILGCHGVAVLPAGMSAERFAWLEDWASAPEDIVRTPGSESNVKEIYDECARLARDEANVIVNQFSEFANYLGHYLCTGQALQRVFRNLQGRNSGLRLAAFVAGTGSAGTIGAGDYLKSAEGARIVAVEPIECPTMLYAGYGEHNIQGIGDKHIPLIQNVMNCDIVAGVSDTSCDRLNVLFNSDEGRAFLADRKGLGSTTVAQLSDFGLSGIANILAAIKTARRLDLSENDVIVTVATDGAQLYESERNICEATVFPKGFDQIDAAEVFGRDLRGVGDAHLLELTHRDRRRIFNQGYYTWVEQQGIDLDEFDSRKEPTFWQALQVQAPAWDRLIEEFNGMTGVNLPA